MDKGSKSAQVDDMGFMFPIMRRRGKITCKMGRWNFRFGIRSLAGILPGEGLTGCEVDGVGEITGAIEGVRAACRAALRGEWRVRDRISSRRATAFAPPGRAMPL